MNSTQQIAKSLRTFLNVLFSQHCNASKITEHIANNTKLLSGVTDANHLVSANLYLSERQKHRWAAYGGDSWCCHWIPVLTIASRWTRFILSHGPWPKVGIKTLAKSWILLQIRKLIPYQRYFLNVLAVTATVSANITAKGNTIKDGCRLNGRARYTTHVITTNGSAAFFA